MLPSTQVPPPLVVDLDGTLTPTDTLIESVIQLIKKSPLNLFKILFWLIRGRAVFKSRTALRVNLAAQHLPYRQPLIDGYPDWAGGYAAYARAMLGNASSLEITGASDAFNYWKSVTPRMSTDFANNPVWEIAPRK